MAGMSSISKACIELSNSIRGFRLGRSAPPEPGSAGGQATGGVGGTPPPSKEGLVAPATGALGRAAPTALSVTNTISRAIKSATNRVKAFERNGHVVANGASGTGSPSPASSPPPLPPPVLKSPPQPPLPNIWLEEKFLMRFFNYFSASERCVLAQVCVLWRDILYDEQYWTGICPLFNCKHWSKDTDARTAFYRAIEQRGFDSICFVGATDQNIIEVTSEFVYCRKNMRMVTLRSSNISDTGLQMLIERLTALFHLELSGCNEITEAGLWSSLNARILSLSINDCINVADDSIGAIAQLLPSLYELNLQAYHVTDAALTFFSAKQSYCLCILRLHSCWEITNHGIVNIIHSLPNLTILSLSGCSKITDDGVELIAENLRKLKSLDLSWCPRITDASLEYIACDLGQLEELTLDRCSHITDIGVGYLSTMTSLVRLFLRWCCQLRDFGLQHLYTMKNLNVLSLAGCNLLTPSGLTGLMQLRGLVELELTNCAGASNDVCHYLRESMPRCLILE